MQKVVVFLLLIMALPVWANMASPYIEGSEIGTTFVNRHASVLSEKLTIVPDSAFEYASIEAEYRISLDSTGVEIPMLFVAKDFAGDFQLSIDGNTAEAQPLSQSKIGFLEQLPFGWEAVLDSAGNEHNSLTVSWSAWHQAHMGMDDLIYFETNLDSGYHEIRVRYTAKTWEDRSDWVKRSFLSYSLSPARYWKGFGGLELVLDNRHFGKNLLIRDIDKPQEGQLDAVATWRFDEIPTDVLTIEYNPQVSRWANLLMGIGPLGISLICIFPFLLVHLLLLSRFRKRNSKKFNPWILLGGLVIPVVWGLFLMNSYSWIDAALGEAAGGRQGYMLIVGLFIVVPILIVGYSLFGVAIDVFLKRKA
ncbi:MAG: hypothetical protein R3B47_02175 [Bacteroidia bacterium]